MTEDRRKKAAVRKLAAEQGISYTEALRVYNTVKDSRDAGDFDSAWDDTPTDPNERIQRAVDGDLPDSE
jgi:hypothetical protein